MKGKRKKERKKTGLEVDVGPSGERQLCRLTVEEEERGESARLKDSKFTVSHSLGPKVHPLLVFSSGHVIFLSNFLTFHKSRTSDWFGYRIKHTPRFDPPDLPWAPIFSFSSSFSFLPFFLSFFLSFLINNTHYRT